MGLFKQTRDRLLSIGVIVAIFSLHHSSIGKSTQGMAYTAAAHIDYITRESALGRLEVRGIPETKRDAMAFMVRAEDRCRANGRVADKLLLALPRELSASQRADLVRGFAEAISKGRAPWFAAFHDKGKDAKNPHCHLLLHDRDPDTGRRVFQTTEKGSTERLRQLWQHHANMALEKAGRNERIDHRTLQAQGIRRRPTIHIGVRARELVRQNYRAMSRERTVRNHCQAHSTMRKVAYPAIDCGKLRLSHSIDIRRSNLFASRAENREADYWASIDEDAFLRDIREMKRLHAVLEYGADGETILRARDERRDIEFER